MNIIYRFKMLFCGLIVSIAALPCLSQNANDIYIYDKNGNKIRFNRIENVMHLGFAEGTDVATKEDVLENLSSMADYTIFSDNSYRFTVNPVDSSLFKINAMRNSCVTYCENEYRDSCNGVVWVTNRIIVKMKPGNSISTLLHILHIPTIQYESKWYDSTVYALVVPREINLFALSNRIFESELVEYAQPAFYYYSSLSGYETNPRFDEQWNVQDRIIEYDQWNNTPIYYWGINAVRAWKFTEGSPDIKIAVLDDGVTGTHEDLSDNFLFEKNYTGIAVPTMINPRAHGTKCAGVISAANNDKGIVGVSHNSQLASFITHCDYLSRDNTPPDNPVIHRFSDELFEEAIHYACDSTNISVFSCSWHLDGILSETFLSAVNYATQFGRNGKGCVLVFSSGNRDNEYESNTIRPTAVLSNVLAVGATTQTGYRISLNLPLGEGDYEWESCYGDSLDLMAPGEMSLTTCYNSNSCYDYFEGTSASAPHVAGVAALVLSMDTNLTYQQVFEILCSSATKVRSDYYSYSHNPSYPYGTWNNETGYGLVNAHHAILKTLYRDYYVTGTSEIGLCETGSYHIHGTTPFNDSITNCWTSSPNIEILSTTDSVIARGIYPGTGWIAFNIIHDNDSLPVYFPITVSNGQISVITNHDITSNTTLSTPYFTNSDLIIDSLATLTITDTLYVAGGSRIIVRPGGKLIVNGGTLTNACDGEMWQGIIVEGNPGLRQQASRQGAVYLTNATVENAHTAISTRGAAELNWWTKTGGIIQATNTLFHNNCSTAEFFEYENHKVNGDVTNNVSYFTRCTFTIDDDNLFAENDTYFLYQVLLTGVRGVKFNGCTFRNEITTSEGLTRGSAIYTEEAGFIAKRVCPVVSDIDPCACEGTVNDPVTRCSFEGFHYAIDASLTLGTYDITIDNCDFSRNNIGITQNVADNVRVSFCDFDLSDSVSYCGVNLDNSTGYTVESNVFHRQASNQLETRGISVRESGGAENVIRKNEFSNLKYGFSISGFNGMVHTKPAYGLQFECNIFNGCGYDFYLNNGSSIRSQQGSGTAGADNGFHYTQNSSFLLATTTPFTYWYSSGNGHIPYNPPATGVTLKGTATANSCSSSLCGYDPLNPEPRGSAALAQYRLMAEELSSLIAEYAARGYDETDDADNTEAAALLAQISDLSAQMGDLSRAAIRTIVGDTVVDMGLLKEWYRTIVETMCTSSLQEPGQPAPVPVAAYQLSEVYSTERDWSAAREALASIPVRFVMDSTDTDEYRNYLVLQQLRENVAGNWYRQTEPEIAELQGVAEHNDGRAARMAKEILCFFHHICYEDEPLVDLEGIGERGLRGDAVHSGDAVHHVSTSTTTADGLRLHPNPAHNTLTVESASPIREIAVYDLTGHAVMVETVHAPSLQQTINTSSLPTGIYLVKVVTDNGTETAKFVKN